MLRNGRLCRFLTKLKPAYFSAMHFIQLFLSLYFVACFLVLMFRALELVTR